MVEVAKQDIFLLTSILLDRVVTVTKVSASLFHQDPSKREVMSIDLETTQVLMRYKSEWDPREAAHTKGGYLEGQIKVPDFHGKMTMVIQTYPAADADPLIATVRRIGRESGTKN